ncbi:MAG: carbohydrate ABC transporter permease [Anaerolineae bacterium]
MNQTRAGSRWSHWLAIAVLCFVAIGWLIPLVWVILVSLRPADLPLREGDILFGARPTLENYVTAFQIAPFGKYYFNTIFITVGVVAVQIVTVTLAGYAFARYTFPGQNVLLFIILLQVLIPFTALVVPNYATIRSLGLFDSRFAIMVPYFGSAFGTLLMRQTFKNVPRDLDDASRMDGADWWQTLYHVYLPAGTAALVAFGLASITYHWNEFLWPLVVTNSENSRPLTVGLAIFTQLGELGAQWPLVSAATLIVVAPLFILFLVFQRQFINSFLRSGLK